MSNRVLFIVMTILAVSTILVGFYVVGGPQQARLEKEDEQLLQDLRRMAGRLKCRDEDSVLPAETGGSSLILTCEGVDRNLQDVHRLRPEAPITYHRDSDTSFRLCAKFHDAVLVARPDYGRDAFKEETGCLHGTIR